MSVLIKNMEMPKGCIYANDKDETEYCPMLNHDDVPFCQYIENEPEAAIGIDERPVYCPILPSAQPEPQWIPCSERLPEKDGRYQVTRYDYVANTEFIDILWHEENLWWNRHSTGDYAVTAWMPLPEPYKRGQE